MGQRPYACRRVREAFLGEFAGADRRDEGVAQETYGVVVRQTPADADRVGAGGDGEDAAAFDAVDRGDGLHLHAVGDDEPVVAEFLAEQTGEDAPGEGGREVGIQRRDQDVRAHHRTCARGDRGPERGEFAGVEHRQVGVDARQRVVRVDRGVAVPGEVLGAGRDARCLEAGDVGGRVPGHQVGVGAEGAYADHGVVRVRVHVRRRCPVEVHPARGQAAAELEGDVTCQHDIVHRPQRVIAGEGGTGAHLESGDVAALLVDGDEHVVPLGTQLGGQGGELVG